MCNACMLFSSTEPKFRHLDLLRSELRADSIKATLFKRYLTILVTFTFIDYVSSADRIRSQEHAVSQARFEWPARPAVLARWMYVCDYAAWMDVHFIDIVGLTLGGTVKGDPVKVCIFYILVV